MSSSGHRVSGLKIAIGVARTSREHSAWLSAVSTTSVVVARGSVAQPTMRLANASRTRHLLALDEQRDRPGSTPLWPRPNS
jgi:hypothetical protein